MDLGLISTSCTWHPFPAWFTFWRVRLPAKRLNHLACPRPKPMFLPTSKPSGARVKPPNGGILRVSGCQIESPSSRLPRFHPNTQFADRSTVAVVIEATTSNGVLLSTQVQDYHLRAGYFVFAFDLCWAAIGRTFIRPVLISATTRLLGRCENVVPIARLRFIAVEGR